MLRKDVPPFQYDVPVGHDPLLELQLRCAAGARTGELRTPVRFAQPKISYEPQRRFADELAMRARPMTTRRQQMFYPKEPRIKHFVPDFVNTTYHLEQGSYHVPQEYKGVSQVLGRQALPWAESQNRQPSHLSYGESGYAMPFELGINPSAAELPLEQRRNKFRLDPNPVAVAARLPSRTGARDMQFEHRRQLMPDIVLTAGKTLPVRAAPEQIRLNSWAKLGEVSALQPSQIRLPPRANDRELLDSRDDC